MKKAKPILRLLAVLACWYGFILYTRLTISVVPGRPRAIQINALAAAQQMERKPFTRDELDNTLSQSRLQYSMTTFRPTVSFHDRTNWVVTLDPQPKEPYNHALWARIVFADFSRARFRSIRVAANEDAQQQD